MKYPKTIKQLNIDRTYYVYYLPEENYCGTTHNPPERMIGHRRQDDCQGRHNTDGWTILYHTSNKKEAHYYESLFQSTLAMEGLDFRPDMWKK